MTRARPLPAELRNRPFRVGGSGLPRSRTRAADLAAPIWGVRVPSGDSIELHTLCSAWTLRMPWYAFFARETAALLHGMPLPSRLSAPAPVHVGVRCGRRRVEAVGVTAHHFALRPGDVVGLGGLRVTSVERTWVDLAAVLSLAELIAAGDALLWRRRPTTTLDQLRQAVERFSGRRGIANLRVALSMLSERADSAPESEIRVALLAARLPAPEVNHPVFGPGGAFIAQPDLTWPSFRTAVEYEGEHHRTDRRQWYEDIRRINELQGIGWTAFRATAVDYANPAALTERVSTALRRGGWNGRPVRHWH